MRNFEYKVVPAPKKGQKSRGIKGPEARFAHAVETLINDLAGEGWEYQRAETLPNEERSGLTSTATQYRTILVFRRSVAPPNAPRTSIEHPPATAQAPAVVPNIPDVANVAPNPGDVPSLGAPEAAQEEDDRTRLKSAFDIKR